MWLLQRGVEGVDDSVISPRAGSVDSFRWDFLRVETGLVALRGENIWAWCLEGNGTGEDLGRRVLCDTMKRGAICFREAVSLRAVGFRVGV